MKLRIEKAIYGGNGLARVPEDEGALGGKAAFVPLTLPGELVEAHVTEDKRSFIHAEVDSVLEPAITRTAPLCPYFGTCGGCSYQHSVYPHQVEMKAVILREAFDRAHIPGVPPIHTVNASPWHYRNRIRLEIQRDPFALCYRERRSHKALPVAECPISASLLEKAITVVTNTERSFGLADFCREVEFFINSDESTLLITFFALHQDRDAGIKLAHVCTSLQSELPELAGARLAFADRPNQLPRTIASWGAESLIYRAAAFDYRVSIGSFFQVNRHLVDALVELVTAGRSGDTAWDLYAGAGLFARALGKNYKRIIAVEPSPSSFADLEHNLTGTPHRAIRATTLDFLRQRSMNAKQAAPDLVIVDPPRAGLGPEVTTTLSRIAPAEIVYVSCDPATLSRDVKALVQSGYDLQTITMVDMFPQTFHLESVSVLRHR